MLAKPQIMVTNKVPQPAITGIFKADICIIGTNTHVGNVDSVRELRVDRKARIRPPVGADFVAGVIVDNNFSPIHLVVWALR